MKIGVALSGCDIGGVCAAGVLHWLQKEGIRINMISASGTASPATLLFCCGFGIRQRDVLLKEFLEEYRGIDLDSAIASLSARLSPEMLGQVAGLVIASTNLPDGKVAAFTNDFTFETETLVTIPLLEPYDALSASIGAVDGLGYYPYQGFTLCDYSVRYGCPIFPLHLAGCDKVLSFSFLPQIPGTAYEVLIHRRIQETGADADLHMALPLPSTSELPQDFAEYQQGAISVLENCRNDLLRAIAF